MKYRLRLHEGDPYLEDVRRRWQDGIVQLVADIPRLQFSEVDRQPGDGLE